MFALSEQELQRPVLSIGDGPASFNAEVHQLYGNHTTSVDIIYQFSEKQIQQKNEEVKGLVYRQMLENKEQFV